MLDKISSGVIEKEISIKLLSYLKRNKHIDEKLYNYILNKLLKKQQEGLWIYIQLEIVLYQVNNYKT